VVTGERQQQLATLYAAFAKEENPLEPLVEKAEREFILLLKKSYEELPPLTKASMSFDAFRYAVIPDIERAAFDHVRKFPAVLPEIRPRK
jgi:hypothetical protein